MTVPIETSRVDYAGNGVTTVFSTVFYFMSAADLRVVDIDGAGVETTKVLGVDFTVTLPASVGAAGSVTMVTAPAAGHTLRIDRDVSLVQDTSFRTQGAFSPAVHEDAMDRLMFAIQELDRRTKALESAGVPASVVAGDGLYFSGTNLHVGAGGGVVVDANKVAADFGLTVDVTKVTSTVGDAGSIDQVARIDHKHDIESGTPNDLVVGDTALEGSAAGVALADHTHGVPKGGTGDLAILDTAAAAAGVSGLFADAAHKHEVKLGNPVTISDSTNADGVDTGFARADHLHAHGSRGGGTLHDVATSSVAGFMSATDKALLERVTETEVTTFDATVTTLATTTPTNTKAVAIHAIVVAKDKATGNSAGYGLAATAKRHGGVTTLTGAVTVLWAHEDVAGWDATIDVSTPDVRVRVTGAAGTNIDWRCRLEVVPS